MKKNIWVKVVVYRGNKRFCIYGKLAGIDMKGRKKFGGPVVNDCVLLQSPILNGFEPRSTDHWLWSRRNTLSLHSVVHIRRLSKDVALAMEM